METSSDKTKLITTPNKKQNNPNKLYIAYIITTICSCVVIALLMINLWQAGIFDSSSPQSESLSETKCSGNGQFYTDINECKCYQCFSGLHCEIIEEDSDCIMSIGGGDPSLLIEYWNDRVRHKKVSNIQIPMDYRGDYDWSLFGPFSSNDNDGLGGTLNQLIRNIHTKYHNINLTDTYIVFGSGTTQLQVAAYHAYSRLKGELIYAFGEVPYYSGYRGSCEVHGTSYCRWNISYALPAENVVEFIAYPNNPDGSERELVYTDTTMWGYDLVYYWPSYYDSVDELEELRAPIAFFSQTKLSGHAATRFGWAIVSNVTLANAMRSYLTTEQVSMQVESVYRTYEIMKYIETNGDDMFDFAREELKKRWDLLEEILEGQNNYIQRSRKGTFFAWIECVNKTEEQAIDLFASYNMRPARGSNYGAPGFVRMSMAEYSANFYKYMERLRILINSET